MATIRTTMARRDRYCGAIECRLSGELRKWVTLAQSDAVDKERTWDNWASVVLSEALIFRPYKAFAVDSFEPANGEMTPSHVLKMLDERVVHGSAA